MFEKLLFLKVSGSFQKKIFSSNAIRVVSKVPSILKTCASSFKIAGRASVVESELAKQQEEISLVYNFSPVHSYVPKSRSAINFEKFSFNGSCRLTVYRLQRYYKETPNQTS